MLTTWPLFLFLSNTLLILGYSPINRFVKGGFAPKHKLDRQLPLVPAFVYPYVFAYFPWIIFTYISIFFRPIPEIQLLTLTTLIASVIGYGAFILMPTYVECIYPIGNGLSYRILQLVHRVDRQNNACPSMHVYMTVILMVFSWTQNTVTNIVVVVVGALIITSTVLTKRHYVLDIVGGVIVGTISAALATYILS